MCGVIGYVKKEGVFPLEDLISLFDESQIRGRHSFGIAWLETGKEEIQEFKTLKLSSLFNKLTSLKEISVDILIGHLRYATSGSDWTDLKMEAQPIILNNVAMVFNGVITQEDLSQYVGLQYRNDGELALNIFDQTNDPEEIYKKYPKASFAGFFLKEGNLIPHQRKRPLWKRENQNNVLFASTRDIFNRAKVENFELALEVNES